MNRLKLLMIVMMGVFSSVVSASMDFDAIVFGDVTTELHFHDSTYVGGNVLGNSTFGLDFDGAYTGYSLVLGGNYTLSNNNIVHGKMLYGGSVTNSTLVTNMTNNGESWKFVHDPAAVAAYGVDKTQWQNLSTDFSNQPSTTITSVSSIHFANTVGVNIQYFDMVGSVFAASNSNFSFTDNDADQNDWYVINVSGSTIQMAGSSNYNALPESLASRIIWNFYEASSVQVKSFYGSILAPDADLILQNDIHGSIVVDSTAGNGQVHGVNGSYPVVPEPATLALVALGMVAGVTHRR